MLSNESILTKSIIMNKIFARVFIIFLLFFSLTALIAVADDVIKGSAPSLTVKGSNVFMAYASGDSILFSYSSDKGKSFSSPALVAVLKDLMVGGGRGPQIVVSGEQLLIAVADKSGDIYSWIKPETGNSWVKTGRINDLAGFAKEGFVSLCANNSGNLFAIWLDLRNGGKNNIYGAASNDGGKTWLKNQLVYKSPDGAVCECCKPSIAMKGQQVVVMFRNNFNGNRDLYVMQSNDGGLTFGAAQKLGDGSWKLNACPMDGGGVVINDDNSVQTVWRREGNVYTSKPGEKEILIGKGMQCAISGINETYYIAFVSEGKLYYRKSDETIIQIGLRGSYPKIIAIDKSNILCAWDNQNRIYMALIN
jgi:hypothetical protein